jgi:hypothetical protein
MRFSGHDIPLFRSNAPRLSRLPLKRAGAVRRSVKTSKGRHREKKEIPLQRGYVYATALLQTRVTVYMFIPAPRVRSASDPLTLFRHLLQL